MTLAEFAFLAAGLVLGAAGGVATAARSRLARARPPVRVTLTPGAVPRRRATTLATDPFLAPSPAPARGGPGDPSVVAGAGLTAPAASARPDVAPVLHGTEADRTGVRNGPPDRVAVPIMLEPDPLLTALRSASRPDAALEAVPALEASFEAASAVPVLVAAGAAAAAGPRAMTGADSRSAGTLGRGLARIMESAQSAAPARGLPAMPTGGDAVGPGSAGQGPSSGDGDALCRDLELEADEQCRLAEAARSRVEHLTAEVVAAEAHRDRQLEASRAAHEAADHGRGQAAREAARATFQAARARASSTGDIDEAARAWLAEIDRLNGEEAMAQGSLERLRAGTEIAVAAAEHLAMQLEAARSAAEAGEVACVYARRRAAECAGVEITAAAADAVAADDALDRDLEVRGEAQPAADEARVPAVPPSGSRPVVLVSRGDAAGPRPAIERVLSGEHEILDDIVARVADDEEGRRHWAERLTALLEAILLAAVDSAAVDVPADHPFWSAFTPEQSRDILTALASLGHHFDGLGGWLDDRAPDQRDLSLAVAHAGLDPMRLRRWPTTAESAELLRDAVILGADYLAAVAPGLTVQELTAVLGREGQALGDVWAEWEIVRPALAMTGPAQDAR